ncbi:hypothetical protein BH11MYX4_BH11MYX4_69240 [soil metagenome]
MMKKSTLSMLLALAPLVIQPACAPDDAEPLAVDDAEPTARTESALLGGSKLLWPMQDGKATVRVCWLPVDLGGETLPGGTFAANLATVLPERKQWVREGVEREWNARTVVQFVGWQDCSAGEADVQIQPISTLAFTYCPTKGNAGFCVEELGSKAKGKRVFINMLFGDEALGEARYVQTVTTKTIDRSKVLPDGVFLPAICAPQMSSYVTHFTAKQPVTAADLASISAVYRDCLQNVSNHEFGHLAGFSHEQNRKDVTAACAAQYQASVPDDPSDEDSPLGTFEEDSIMSYCRVTLPGTITGEDAAQTNAFYAKLAPKLPSATPQSESGTATESGDDPVAPAEAAVPAKKKRSVAQPATGGCNGG